MQANYQQRHQDKTSSYNCIDVLLHCKIRSKNTPLNMVLRPLHYGIDTTLLWYRDHLNMVLRPF